MTTSSTLPAEARPEAAALDAANPYAAPATALPQQTESEARQVLYVVAPRKFLLLMILTLGAYSLYWFYRTWSLLNRVHKIYWPIPRAIFSIFFTHSLFGEVDGQLRTRGVDHRWTPGMLATIFVVATIASRVFDRVTADDASPGILVVSFLFLVPMIWPLYRAQLAINLSQDDPDGATNAELTAANILWMVLGGALWALILFGLLMSVRPVESVLC